MALVLGAMFYTIAVIGAGIVAGYRRELIAWVTVEEEGAPRCAVHPRGGGG